MEKKNYSKQEKLKILKEASEKGLKPKVIFAYYPNIIGNGSVLYPVREV